MIGSPSEVWAAAHLDPVSPAPVHPPSPITVPMLQDQADTYFNTPLSGDPGMNSAIARAPEANTALVASVTIHDSAPDTALLDREGTRPDKVDAVTESADIILADVTTRDMPEIKTSQPGTANTRQPISKSNKSALSSDMSALTAENHDTTISVHKNNPSALRPPPLPAPVHLPRHTAQPAHQLPEESQLIADTAVLDASNTQISPSLREYSHANSNHHSAFADPASLNIQAILDTINAQAANQHFGAVRDPITEGTPNGHVLPPITTVASQPSAPNQVFAQPYRPVDKLPPGLPQTNGTPLLSTNGPIPRAYPFTAPGTVGSDASAAAISALVPMPSPAIPASQHRAINGSLTLNYPLKHQKQTWDNFRQEEKKYVSEAEWNQFPEGSRIFIGNLASERIHQRDVFGIFSDYGHLAQVSIKQGFGFAQYRTAAEGQDAIDHLQGIELGGKRLNLEISRTTRKDGEGNRSSRGRRNGDRRNGNRERRDDHRPNIQSSPQRSSHRQQPSSGTNTRRNREDSSFSRNRQRSQSPRHSVYDGYRHRSDSPPRQPSSVSNGYLPHHHRTEVPDVQFLVRDASQSFVASAHDEFARHGLKINAWSLNPSSSTDEAIRHLVADGVSAVVELDFGAEQRRSITLLLFDRSAGSHNVRYEEYQDLQPNIAAQLIVSRRVPPPYHSSQQGTPVQNPPTYTPALPYAHTDYSYPVIPHASHHSQNSAMIQPFQPTSSNYYGLGGPPAHYIMGHIQPPPNPALEAFHPGNSAAQLSSILTQLAVPRQ
ncbi:hypothetical protein F4678DRAFT_200406 [Xylaria arbuscula]|nr:hypothetical protein F4678DRAFT_200406 [Xylaria arbuscula]